MRLRSETPESFLNSLIMPSKSSVTRNSAINARGAVYQSKYRNVSSNWVLKNGKPDLSAQNPHSLQAAEVSKYYTYPVFLKSSPTVPRWAPDPGDASDQIVGVMVGSAAGIDWQRLEQIALAKFKGKLRKGSASLGVTAASWRQSRDMIIARSSNLAKRLELAERSLKKDKKRLRAIKKQKDPLASFVLETKFGWQPLFEDIFNALGVVCLDNLPPTWLKGVHKSVVSKVSVNTAFDSSTSESITGVTRSTVAASVKVSNPNLWMLNQLGLINPGVVIWDLIPWSFVVNMFVNVNAMINQFTDEVGLDISKQSVTHSSQLRYEVSRWSKSGVHGRSGSTIDMRHRGRTVGTLPSVKWQVRVPELNWELAVIASSLVVQRFHRINRLIGF